jgi:hypothetical protein
MSRGAVSRRADNDGRGERRLEAGTVRPSCQRAIEDMVARKLKPDPPRGQIPRASGTPPSSKLAQIIQSSFAGRATTRPPRRTASSFQDAWATTAGYGLFLIAEQFSLRTPDLQAVPVDYIVVWPQGFGGFDRQFEGLKHLHGMTSVRRNAKRSM